VSNYSRDAVLPTVLQAAHSTALAVRLAAVKALETTGDASALPFLLETAAKTRGAEQVAARSAIGSLKGRAVDEAVLAQLAGSPAPEILGELLLAVGDRRIFAAKKAVSAAIASPSSELRTRALKALRVIGTPSDVPAVLDLLVKSEDGPERAEAEAAAAALAQKTLRPEARAATLKTRLAAEQDPQARARLMAVLPLMGDPSTLPTLRSALGDADRDVYDAAVRALTSWPTTAARDDVLRLARDSRNETYRLLAIAALVRLVGVDRHREPAAAVSDLRAAAAFSWRPEEQRLVLGALVQFPCPDALDLATGFLREPTVKPEAEAAVEKIKAKMK
jgi:HEAT repeat protein